MTSLGAIAEGDTGGPFFHVKDGQPECLIGVSSFSVEPRKSNGREVFNIFTIAGAFYNWLKQKAEFLSGANIVSHITG